MDEQKKAYTSKEEIIAHARKFHPDDDMSVVEKAYDFAEKAHSGQKRKSGEPYFVHPTAVAVILADIMVDPDTIAAGLLHDVVEDCDGITIDVIGKTFGEDIAAMVDGVTKLEKQDFLTKDAQKAEAMRKMFAAMAHETRVVFIKLADRLNNMRTLDTQSPERRIPIARETLDIYAPLAHRLGVYRIKSELEDLCLKYLEPAAYVDISRRLESSREEHENWIKHVTEILKNELPKQGIKNFTISGRVKHVYSIFNKMRAQNKEYDEIMDLVALRIIVETYVECYTAMGVVHGLWKAVDGKFKDYITSPKWGIYQSLHTTVMGEKHIFEVQIRTKKMHENAEFGIAAHWRYKKGHSRDLDNQLTWLNHIIDWTGETEDPDAFSNYLHTELFAREVCVYTPNGDVRMLPIGSTPVDFAATIHKGLLYQCCGARVNNKIVQLSTPLKTGDVVEIIKAPNEKGPSYDWLGFVKTAAARRAIRSYRRAEERDSIYERGKDAFE